MLTGLCGIYNSDPSDDFTFRNDTIFTDRDQDEEEGPQGARPQGARPQPVEFIQDWRLEIHRTKDNECWQFLSSEIFIFLQLFKSSELPHFFTSLELRIVPVIDI